MIIRGIRENTYKETKNASNQAQIPPFHFYNNVYFIVYYIIL